MNNSEVKQLKSELEKLKLSNKVLRMELSDTVQSYSPIEVAIALALYGYNVSALERAQKIYDHFDGNCADMHNLVSYMINYGCAPTAMAFPSAEVYVSHALERYGEEAKRRVHIESVASMHLDLWST